MIKITYFLFGAAAGASSVGEEKKKGVVGQTLFVAKTILMQTNNMSDSLSSIYSFHLMTKNPGKLKFLGIPLQRVGM